MLPEISAKRFLVVDDMPEMVETVADMLRHYGIRDILRANGAETALAVLRAERKLDCVISDFNMGQFNGLEMLSLVRSGGCIGIPRDQRFILLTGHGEAEVVRTALALDVNGYIVKPVALKTLIQTVERAFNRAINLKTTREYQAIKAIKAPT